MRSTLLKAKTVNRQQGNVLYGANLFLKVRHGTKNKFVR